MTLDQFKDAALKTAKVLGHILLTIFKYALTIIAALGSIVFDIFKFFFKEKEWSRDDEDFYQHFKNRWVPIDNNDIHKYYTQGPVFFSKKFEKETNQQKQQKCLKGWNVFLANVASARKDGKIKW